MRGLSVAIAMFGAKVRSITSIFLGWFGPRGLASIVFGIIVLGENLPGGSTLAITVVCTVFLSIVAHGLTANPLASAIAAKVNQSRSGNSDD